MNQFTEQPNSWRAGLEDSIAFLDVYRSDIYITTNKDDGSGLANREAHYQDETGVFVDLEGRYLHHCNFYIGSHKSTQNQS